MSRPKISDNFIYFFLNQGNFEICSKQISKENVKIHILFQFCSKLLIFDLFHFDRFTRILIWFHKNRSGYLPEKSCNYWSKVTRAASKFRHIVPCIKVTNYQGSRNRWSRLFHKQYVIYTQILYRFCIICLEIWCCTQREDWKAWLCWQSKWMISNL